MALGDFAPGYYDMTYNSLATGLVKDVRRLRRRSRASAITADKYGDSMVDGVYRGGDCFLMMTFIEWNAAVRAVLWPYDTDFGAMGPCGRLLTDLAKVIVLTAEAGSAAAAEGFATVTANKAILAPENDVEVIMGNENRDVPVLLQLFPYQDGSDMRWFSYT